MQGADARYERVHGLAGAEKSMATILFNYTGNAQRVRTSKCGRLFGIRRVLYASVMPES